MIFFILDKAQKQNSQLIQELPIGEVDEDVNVMSTAQEILKFFKKDSLIIWLDTDAISSKQSGSAKKLEAICELKILDTLQDVIDLVQKTKSYCTIIAPEANGEELVKNIHDRDDVGSIFILTDNKDGQIQWASKYKKKVQVSTDLKDIIEKVDKCIQDWSNKKSSLRQDLPVFSPIFNDDDTTDNNYLKINLMGLSQFENRPQSKKDFLSLAKLVYCDKKNEKEFNKQYDGYDKQKIIKWYTADSFLYKLTNNCLRIAKSDTIYYSRLILKDLERAIKEIYQSESKMFSGLLYRGVYISDEEWAQLEQNCGKDIEMYGFMSTSKDKDIAIGYMQEDMNKKIFITVIVPDALNGEGQGFAEIEKYSEFETEAEVLFNIRSRFTVLKTTMMKDGPVEYRHLVLLYGAQEIRKHLLMQNPVIELKVDTDKLECAKCKLTSEKALLFADIGNPDKKICYKCLDSVKDQSDILALVSLPIDQKDVYNIKLEGRLARWKEMDCPFYGYSCSSCKGSDANGYFVCQSCPESKRRLCNPCFENNPHCIEKGHLIIFENRPYTFWYEKMSEMEHVQSGYKYHVENQGDALYFTNQPEKAKEYFEKSLEQNAAKDETLASVLHQKLGRVYEELAQLDKAMDHYWGALRLKKKIYGDVHIEIASSYGIIGSLHHSLGQFEKAKGFHKRALKIYKLLQGDNSPQVGRCYDKLGIIYYELDQYEDAKQCFLNALGILRPLYGDNQPKIARVYNSLGILCETKGEFPDAEDYHLKALAIERKFYGTKHPITAASYHNLGSIYTTIGQLEKAQECQKMAMKIKISAFGNESLKTAALKNSMGSRFFMQGQNEESLQYFSDALKVAITVYGENHPKTAISYNNVGKTYHRLKQFKEAEKNLKKALDISLLGENRSLTGICYINLGLTYCKLDDFDKFDKSQECIMKGIKIIESIYGKKHHELGPGYNGLGLVREGLNDFENAIKYFKMALEIYEAAYKTTHHPDIGLNYTNIGLAYCSLKNQKEAKKYLMKAFEIFEVLHKENASKVFCNLHPGIERVFFSISYGFHSTNQLKDARDCYSVCLKIFEFVYGKKHRETITIYINLGSVYNALGQTAKGDEYHGIVAELLGFDYKDE